MGPPRIPKACSNSHEVEINPETVWDRWGDMQTCNSLGLQEVKKKADSSIARSDLQVYTWWGSQLRPAWRDQRDFTDWEAVVWLDPKSQEKHHQSCGFQKILTVSQELSSQTFTVSQELTYVTREPRISQEFTKCHRNHPLLSEGDISHELTWNSKGIHSNSIPTKRVRDSIISRLYIDISWDSLNTPICTTRGIRTIWNFTQKKFTVVHGF